MDQSLSILVKLSHCGPTRGRMSIASRTGTMFDTLTKETTYFSCQSHAWFILKGYVAKGAIASYTLAAKSGVRLRAMWCCRLFPASSVGRQCFLSVVGWIRAWTRVGYCQCVSEPGGR